MGGGQSRDIFRGGPDKKITLYYFATNVLFLARNCNFASFTQYNLQYIPCNSALLAQEKLFMSQKSTFLPNNLCHPAQDPAKRLMVTTAKVKKALRLHGWASHTQGPTKSNVLKKLKLR